MPFLHGMDSRGLREHTTVGAVYDVYDRAVTDRAYSSIRG